MLPLKTATRKKSVLLIFALLSMIGAVNLVRCIAGSLDIRSTFRDFANIYCGQELARTGLNPYETRNARALWESVDADSALKAWYKPGLPEFPILYPPWALAQFRFLHRLPFNHGVTFWFMLLVISTGTAAFCACRLLTNREPSRYVAGCLAVLLLIVAFKGTVQALLVGQPFFLFWMLLMAGIVQLSRRRDTAAGILIGLGLGKVSLGIPLIIMLTVTKQWKALGIAAGTVLFFTVAFFLRVHDPLAIAASFLNSMQEFNMMLFGPDNANYPFFPQSAAIGATQLTELGAIIRLFDAHAFANVKYVYLIVAAAAIAFHIANRAVINARPLLFAAYWGCCLSLVSYTQYYDVLWLLVLILLALANDDFSMLPWFFAVNVLNFIPVNGILNRLPDLPAMRLLYLWLPLTMAANMGLIVAAVVRLKTAPPRGSALSLN